MIEAKIIELGRGPTIEGSRITVFDILYRCCHPVSSVNSNAVPRAAIPPPKIDIFCIHASGLNLCDLQVSAPCRK